MKPFSELDRLLLKPPEHPQIKEGPLLVQATLRDPLHGCLFSDTTDTNRLFTERLQAWQRWLKGLAGSGASVFARYSPFTVWRYPFALAQWIGASNLKFVGFAGAPGIGKTTLVSLIADCALALRPKLKALPLSLDDFYLSKQARLERGIRWRAQTGSHDMPLLLEFAEAFKRGERLWIPHFDHGRDDCLPPTRTTRPLDLVLLEGWLLGLPSQGYQTLTEKLDSLILIDGPLSLAKKRRHAREEGLRWESNGTLGFTHTQMNHFWQEILQPGIERWVPILRQQANLVISLDESGLVTGAHTNPVPLPGEQN